MARFQPNPGFARQAANDVEIRAALRGEAERIADHARSLMHRGPDPRHGHTADQFVVEDEDGEIRVGIDDFAGHLVEFGSVNNAPFAPLRRGVQAAGLELHEER
jgi:hypothetical protein